MLKPITLQVEAPIADAYQNANSEHKQALQAIVSLFLKSISANNSLQTIAQEIRSEAEQKGLTSEILEELLKDE
jgi:hypothetical protein